ncbi:MAG: ROK family protein [Rhodomicrobium sp.]|nr:ROK family protein [Rhodomicrobium sp.]
MWRIGVDLGGTKIEALALSPTGEERCRVRIPSPRGDYDATLDAIVSLVDRCTQGLAAPDIAGIGIGIPGSVSPRTGLIRNANSTWLNDRPLHRDLQARFQWPVAIENDANCFAVSEAADGAGQGYRTVFGVILGTGVGGALVIDGRPLIGHNAVAGEWGHNPLPWPDAEETPGPACYCGKRGCIETFLSGPALEKHYLELSGQAADAKSIAESAELGETLAKRALSAYAKRLAKSLATVVNIVDPDVIVFGGGISNISIIMEMAAAELPAWVFSDYFDTLLKVNRWGDSSGVRGAAGLICPR